MTDGGKKATAFQWNIKMCALIAILVMGANIMTVMGQTESSSAESVRLEKTTNGEYFCKTAHYEAIVDNHGNLRSLLAGETQFLGLPTGFAHAGQIVRTKTVKQTTPDTLVAEGEPKDPAKAVPNSLCPLDVRVTYQFLPDHIQLTLEQSMDAWSVASFAWVPSGSVLESRDALTDCATQPGGPALYGQTDPRWTTKAGPVLRFDFGVWQTAFANAFWVTFNIDGKAVPILKSIIPSHTAPKANVYPLAHPAPSDALTFDISAENLDFLLPEKKPVHFDIKVKNAGPIPVEAVVRFEVRDYLTQKPVASKATEVKLASKAEIQLPTDLTVKEPGPYRGAIVIEEAGKITRSFWWVFTYDFQHYAPATTRAPDFKQFWQDALKESSALPLDIKMTLVPEQSTAAFDAYRISYATLGGRRIYGWYARPKLPGKYPARIRFPSSGIYAIAGPEGYADRCSLWIQIHGFDVDLANMPTGDDPGKNYWTAGIESPKTSMWRTIYISLARAVDFMLAQPEIDPTRLAVYGGSQGGGLSLVAAALNHRVAFCMPGYSGLPRLDWTVKYAPGYWPFGMSAKPKDQTEKQFLQTLSYFDAANFTPDIACPVAAEVGLMDTVTAAGNQICAFAHVPKGQLYLVCSPWAMHGAGSRDAGLVSICETRFLKGEKPFLTPTKP